MSTLTQLPPPPPAPPHHHRRLLLIPILAATATTISLLVFLLLSLFLYRRYRSTRTAPSSPSILKPVIDTVNLRRFSYSQLRRATSSFAPSLKVGQGGFGSVFAGSLKSTGQEIAVKVMDSGSLQGVREFQNEISLAEKIPDRKSVILPVGYCVDTKLYSYWKRINFCEGKNHDDTYDGELFGNERVLLVYDLMHNGSLQDALLGKKCPELLDWKRRFWIALDIARGLEFLHVVCVPPIVHGDIKPSNVLLDLRFNAKIADFGLARVKNCDQLDEEEEEEEEEEIVVKVDDLVCDDSPSPKKGKEEDVASDASAIVVAIDKFSDEASTSEFIQYIDGMSVESEKETTCCSNNNNDTLNINNNNNKQRFRKKGPSSVGKDWWWRQDNNVGASTDSVGGGGVKDYVMEWIRSEIKKERPKSDWNTTPVVSSEDCLPKSLGWSERKKQQRRLEWWVSLDEERLKKENKKSSARPAREWWREEFCEELTKKQERKKQRMVTKSRSSVSVREKAHWWEEDDDDDDDCESSRSMKRKNKRESCELKRTITGRRNRDWSSLTEIPKSGNAVSSTPSMRGTVCYTAPECGGGEPLSEKCDVYSFGVLLLVLISGRRPLQVTASPMSEFERANLISWARHLAQSGRVLELVDPSVKGLDKEQALLCITVALLCIQRSPLNRPCIREIVQMLTGQSEAPHLPFEFSPSPPGGFLCKSRKRRTVS